MADLALTAKYVPDVPLGWDAMANRVLPGARAFRRKGDKLYVLFTASHWPGDDRIWIHVSASFPNKTPSYQDMAEVKRLFVGEDRKAMHIFPARQYHVNIHEHCLHLFSCVEGDDGLPEFGAFGSI
ncbi:DUF7694 domain-containing protein [Oryzomonas rubra]|uniref:DUF7694 domain-containing protein n=1 Tax=Oryzomonas rubra TaxID=2509454 RepID=A0A5A9X6J2_9BACT|nr:hypothetical protein [Oryzomonas rubra]KAA0888792.1 hypothetical protein ET418_15540 [Oryzomonas rubra]